MRILIGTTAYSRVGYTGLKLTTEWNVRYYCLMHNYMADLNHVLLF
jgi:hypothetical protein